MNPITDVPAFFGCDVFSKSVMKERLRPAIYTAWKECIDKSIPLSLPVANEIAEAMKQWAIEKGATHYTHWFQPMTGITAEKHDSFISPTQDGKVIMSFTGKSLVRGEPDASSLPSGGLRATFEARGYTAWDPTAFAFVRDGSLYIPTCFFSFTGEALDMKTPLLRSMSEVSREAVRILRLFGDRQTMRVYPCVGIEQEYFLLPKDLYDQREDLRLTGRTLFGAPPPKGQELNDHYFSTIRTEVSQFMQDLDEQLWRLGILAKTKHNETAPCQHELAPIYTDANSACDWNQLTMQVMKKCAAKHHLVCLLHEKPFDGINGSGKHNNWSLSTDSGTNLLSPGNTPHQNAQFLLFLAAFIKGIDEYQDLLRCTVASAGNDHRLGGHEAPPAVISVSLGDELSEVVDSIIQGSSYDGTQKRMMRIGVDVLPSIPKDTSDRNRTSPLAFTGNKFELRMPGSSQSIAEVNTILNTIMADELGKFADVLEKAVSFHDSLQQLIRSALLKHQRILFSGNCYTQSWEQEAQKRGLCNHRSTAECLQAYANQKNVDLVVRRGVYTEEEFFARHAIHMENYCNVIRIEALTCTDIVLRQILPASLTYSKELCESVNVKRGLNVSFEAEEHILSRLSAATDAVCKKCMTLQQDLKSAPEDAEEAVAYYHTVILADMKALRRDGDLLEQLTGKQYWPFPSYADLLFY